MKQKSEFKEAKIGMLPEGWEEASLSEAININPKRELKKGDTAIKVSMDGLSSFNKKIQYFEISKFSGGSKFVNEDTLMARITPCLENGKTVFVDILKDNEVGFGSTEFIVLSGKQGKTTAQFVYYLSISPQLRKEAIKSMTGTSGRQRVQNDLLAEIRINIPSLPEQLIIAKILSDLDSKIELNQRMNKTLEAIGQAIFNNWFNVDDIPDNWETKPLDKIAEFLNGLPLQKYPAVEGEEYLPVIKIRELRNGISEQTDKANLEIPEAYLIEDGDVLFSWSGTLEVEIWTNGQGALNQHLFKVSSEDYPKWFYYYWTKYHLKRFRHIAKGKATTMGHIQRHNLSESNTIVPDKKTLGDMDKMMSPLVEKIILLRIESRRLSAIRDSLLPRLMSGRIRVPV